MCFLAKLVAETKESTNVELACLNSKVSYWIATKLCLTENASFL